MPSSDRSGPLIAGLSRAALRQSRNILWTGEAPVDWRC